MGDLPQVALFEGPDPDVPPPVGSRTISGPAGALLRIDRFTVLIGPEDYADHILDMADVQPEEDGDELDELVDILLDMSGDQQDTPRDELREMVSSLRWGMPGELMCGHGSKSYGTDLVSFSEYAAEHGVTECTPRTTERGR